jgi:hypothetical protein
MYQHVTVRLNNFHHLMLPTDVTVNDVRNVFRDFYCLVYTKLSKASIVRQWNNETAGF